MVLRSKLENPSQQLDAALRAYRQLGPAPVMTASPMSDAPLLLPQPRLQQAQLEQVIAAYNAGSTANEIGAQYGVNRKTVCRHVKAAGVRLRVSPLSEPERLKAIRLYEQGWSLARVGKQPGRDHTVIRDVLRRAGIPRRDSQRRERLS